MDKKFLHIGAGISVILFLIIGVWHVGSSSVKNIEIEYSTGTLSFSDAELVKEQTSRGYSYYQVYFYPKEYTILCEGNESACLSVEKNASEFSNHSLQSTGKKLAPEEGSDVVLPINFEDSERNTLIVKEVFTSLFMSHAISSIDTKGVENKESDSLAIEESLMLQMCREQIGLSIPQGTGDRDRLIEQRILEECSGMENIDTVELAFGGLQEKDDNKVRLDIAIEEFSLEYRFFTFNDGEYDLASSERKDVKKPVNISGEFNLRELVAQ